MKVLHICEYLPLEGLGRENDFAIKMQHEINHIDGSIEFVFLKSFPYSNIFLALIKQKWSKYREYIKQKEVMIGGYRTIIFPWIKLPTTNFRINQMLLEVNKKINLKRIEKLLGDDIYSFDLILSQNNVADGVVAKYLNKKFNIPYIHVIRGEMNDKSNESTLVKEIITHAKICITPSPTMHNYYLKQHKNVPVVTHGIDDSFFYKEKKNFSKAKFITIARLLDWKNIDWVLDALKHAKEKGLTFEYVIVGDGPERKYLEEKSMKLDMQDQIRFLGWLDQAGVINQLQKSNILVLPSFPETLGRVYLEAAAAGCLCIGHEGSGVDGLLENRKSALFCNAHNLNDIIIEVIEDINTQKIQDYIDSAFPIIESLSWEAIANQYIELFKKAIK